jgi:hypothetical protein
VFLRREKRRGEGLILLKREVRRRGGVDGSVSRHLRSARMFL